MSDFLQVSVPIVVSGIYLYALLESTVAELGTTKFLREKLIKKQVDVTTTRQQPSSCCHEKQTECSICLEAYKPAETIACTNSLVMTSFCLAIWTLVTVLTTYARSLTSGNWDKLMRLIKYLNGTIKRIFIIHIKNGINTIK